MAALFVAGGRAPGASLPFITPLPSSALTAQIWHRAKALSKWLREEHVALEAGSREPLRKPRKGSGVGALGLVGGGHDGGPSRDDASSVGRRRRRRGQRLAPVSERQAQVVGVQPHGGHEASNHPNAARPAGALGRWGPAAEGSVEQPLEPLEPPGSSVGPSATGSDGQKRARHPRRDQSHDREEEGVEGMWGEEEEALVEGEGVDSILPFC